MNINVLREGQIAILEEIKDREEYAKKNAESYQVMISELEEKLESYRHFEKLMKACSCKICIPKEM
jgi:hypothetical protein